MKPGEDIKEVDKGIKKKWRWAWMEAVGIDGKRYGSWCQRLRQPGGCYCTVCARKLFYGSSGRSGPAHNASVRFARADVPASMTDRGTDLKIRVCSFIAEFDLSFTIAQPLVTLCRKLAEDRPALAHLSVSRQHASCLLTGISPEFKKRLSEKLHHTMTPLNWKVSHILQLKLLKKNEHLSFLCPLVNDYQWIPSV